MIDDFDPMGYNTEGLQDILDMMARDRLINELNNARVVREALRRKVETVHLPPYPGEEE